MVIPSSSSRPSPRLLLPRQHVPPRDAVPRGVPVEQFHRLTDVGDGVARDRSGLIVLPTLGAAAAPLGPDGFILHPLALALAVAFAFAVDPLPAAAAATGLLPAAMLQQPPPPLPQLLPLLLRTDAHADRDRIVVELPAVHGGHVDRLGNVRRAPGDGGGVPSPPSLRCSVPRTGRPPVLLGTRRPVFTVAGLSAPLFVLLLQRRMKAVIALVDGDELVVDVHLPPVTSHLLMRTAAMVVAAIAAIAIAVALAHGLDDGIGQARHSRLDGPYLLNVECGSLLRHFRPDIEYLLLIECAHGGEGGWHLLMLVMPLVHPVVVVAGRTMPAAFGFALLLGSDQRGHGVYVLPGGSASAAMPVAHGRGPIGRVGPLGPPLRQRRRLSATVALGVVPRGPRCTGRHPRAREGVPVRPRACIGVGVVLIRVRALPAEDHLHQEGWGRPGHSARGGGGVATMSLALSPAAGASAVATSVAAVVTPRHRRAPLVEVAVPLQILEGLEYRRGLLGRRGPGRFLGITGPLRTSGRRHVDGGNGLTSSAVAPPRRRSL
mmetsp:Transcript_49326/g.148524  ORF Transcript_49326/g.148524 Transcript_49326/m.148524 type:complete len:547 (-) Transcript_49326:798-2438(-)